MNADPNENTQAPKVFVSYAHETPDHKRWVKSLGSDLRRHGVNALLDEWKVAPGGDFTLFMEQIRTSDRVLLVCTPMYARKANEGEGGVGYERSVVTAELARSIDTTKFVCVIRDGDANNAIPIFAQSRRYLDFREDSEYSVHLEELLRELHSVPLDPEPPVGPNPFARERALDDSDRFDEPSSPETPKAESPEMLLEKAAVLLSGKDMVGWKRLVRKARRTFEKRITEWSSTLSPGDVSKDGWMAAFNRGVESCEPLFALALSAIDSEIDSVRDQTGMIDVILSLEAWPRGGSTRVIEMPRAIAFLYHELVGAHYVDSRHHADAIRLLTTRVPDRASSRAKPIHRDSELMGYLTSLGGDCMTTWRYYTQFYESREWLHEFFSNQREFLNSYRAYNLLGSVIELSAFLAGGGSIEAIQRGNVFVDVPPMFLHPINDRGADMEVILNLAIPNGDTLAEIVRVTQCDAKLLHDAWVPWYQHLIRFLSGSDFRLLAHRISLGTIPALPK